MPRNVRICDDHVDNLKKNAPCGTCPVRPDAEKYIVDNTTKKQAAMLFTGAIALVMGALVIVGWDYLETKDNALRGFNMASSNKILIDNHKEVLFKMTEGFERLSEALNDLRVVIAKDRNHE
jgi:hypothetical protein